MRSGKGHKSCDSDLEQVCSSMCNNYQHLWLCVCLRYLFALPPALLPCQGHWWSVEVKSYKSPLLPPRMSSSPPSPSPLRPDCPHPHPDSGLQGLLGLIHICSYWGSVGIRGNRGQLLLCFNWHYHFSRLTEMDRCAGPSSGTMSRGTGQSEARGGVGGSRDRDNFRMNKTMRLKKIKKTKSNKRKTKTNFCIEKRCLGTLWTSTGLSGLNLLMILC